MFWIDLDIREVNVVGDRVGVLVVNFFFFEGEVRRRELVECFGF